MSWKTWAVWLWLFSCFHIKCLADIRQPWLPISAAASRTQSLHSSVILQPNVTCPACPTCPFDCRLNGYTCLNYGMCSADSGLCSCKEGFSQPDCKEPLCDSPERGNGRTVRIPGNDCNCDPGWSGSNCNVCQEDAACRRLLSANGPGTSNVSCLKTGRLERQGFFWCDITNDMIKSLEPRISMECDISAESCVFQFWNKVDEYHEEAFACQLEECKQPTNSLLSGLRCKRTSCKCQPGSELCDLIHGIVDKVVGSARWACEDHRRCSLHQDILDLYFQGGVMANCDMGECVANADAVIPVKNSPTVAILIEISVGLLMTLMFLVMGIRYWICNQASAPLYDQNAFIREYESLLAHTEKIDLAFENISYDLGKNQILKNVCGVVKAGQTLAIMGPSGAGKSTLLDILAQKSKRGNVTGCILFNGKQISRRSFVKIAAFVDQDDTLMSSLTVRETLMYSARLRLPRNTSDTMIRSRVEEVMSQLGIRHLANNVIGGQSKRGLSGGERRRVSIAEELVTSPSVLFLDEPTSGLDAYNAGVVVECLIRLAKNFGRTIVLTIHQPRSNIFSQFDALLLLSSGQSVYHGPCLAMSQYLSNSPLNLVCPPGFNIADFAVDVIMQAERNEHAIRSASVVVDAARVETLHLIVDSVETQTIQPSSIDIIPPLSELVRLYKNSALFATTKNEIEQQRSSSEVESSEAADHDADSSQKSITTWQQIFILSGRTILNFYRDPNLMISHFGISLFLGVLSGFLFWQVTNDLPGVQNRLGCLFFFCALLGFASLSSLELFHAERQLFIRERANGYYSTLAFFSSKVVFDVIPLRVIPPLLLGATSYYMIGLHSDISSFLKFLLALVLFNLVAASVCLVIGALLKRMAVANLSASLTMLFGLLFSGFLLNKEKIPRALSWLQYISFFNWGFEALITNELRNILIQESDIVSVEIPGSIILVRFGFDPNAYWRNVGILASMAVFYLALAFLCLKHFTKEQR